MSSGMELCTVRGTLTFPSIGTKHHSPKHIKSLLHCKRHFPSTLKHTRFSSGLKLYSNTSLKLSTSDGTSTETTLNGIYKAEPIDEIIVKDTMLDEKKDTPLDEKKEELGTQLTEASEEESLVDNSPRLLKFLEDYDIKKFDYPESYSILILGGGGLVALWLAAAVVGAIDSIPVFPKVLELVGLGYTIWFSTRYLLFKENRDELVARVEQIKQEVLGWKDD